MLDIALCGNGNNLFSFAPKINKNKNVYEMQDNKETGQKFQQGLALHHP